VTHQVAQERTGRTFVREKHTCESCKTRQRVGVPKSGEGTWPARLYIAEGQMDVLLLAAAEFRDLCEEAGEYADAVSFVDWVRPDAVKRGYSTPVGLVEPEPVTLAEKRRRHEKGRVA